MLIDLFFYFLWEFCIVEWYILQYQFPVGKVTKEDESSSTVQAGARNTVNK